jgi:hypothetical protein
MDKSSTSTPTVGPPGLLPSIKRRFLASVFHAGAERTCEAKSASETIMAAGQMRASMDRTG